jgi:aspartate racemase
LSAARVAAGGSARVALLASTAVHNTDLYKNAFAAYGITMAPPTHQDELMALIGGVKRGDTGMQAQTRFGQIARTLVLESDLLLVACSELSIISAGITVPFEDSLDVLAQAIVEFATK